MQPQSEAFDAIVVGSGISGGWAAKELTERGLRVLLLERGKDVEHVKDYPNARKAPWEYPHRGGRTHAMEEAYPVLKRDYPLNEKNLEWWANEKDSPYTEVKRFDWYRGYHVGGRSLTWGRQSYRLSDLDFEANAKDGIAIDWPIRYADLAPWYDHVERFAGVAGSVEGLPQLPDGQFQPAMPLNVAEERIAGRLAKQFGGRRRLIPGRVANLTRPLPGRGRCQYRNACWLGCPYGAYFSTQSSTLPAAAATGRLTLKTFQIVTDVVYDAGRKRATGVRAIDAATGASTVYSAKVVFVCASTINSTWLLMRSARDVWPGGLGSSSGELGHNLMDHHFRLGANGTIDDLEDRNVNGRGPRASTFRATATSSATSAPTCAASATRAAPAARAGSARSPSSVSAAHSRTRWRRPGAWQMGATAFGEMLPNHANRITIDETKKDKWGLPVVAIDCATGENERLMRTDMMNDMAEMLEATGVKDVRVYDNTSFPGMGIHEMGTARMGRDPKTSVLNAHSQVWDCTNVFVTDGSGMASSGCQNPSLTYMALTARAAAFAVDELKRGNL